jgi:microcystin-dependent protein
MSDQFLAEIRIFPYNFAPLGWAFCDGQLLPISQNTALFSLLGTNYGGNGQTNFALPDLQGNFPMHYDQGPGLSNRVIGETGGEAQVTLTVSQLPMHTHPLSAGSGSAPQQSSSGFSFGNSPSKPYEPGPANHTNSSIVQLTGNSLPHNNLPPYLALNFCIAMTGIFPSRS